MSAAEVDAYLARLDGSAATTLQRLRETIAELLPEADEGLSYGVPAFRVDGTPVAGFSAAERHLSYLPHSGDVIAGLPPGALEGFEATKGAVRMPLDTPLPRSVVARLLVSRLREIGREADLS